MNILHRMWDNWGGRPPPSPPPFCVSSFFGSHQTLPGRDKKHPDPQRAYGDTREKQIAYFLNLSLSVEKPSCGGGG